MACVRKRKNRWQAQIRRKGSPTASKTFLAKQDALAWAREAERLIERGELLQPKPIVVEINQTFKDIVCRYENEITPKKKSAPKELFYLRVIKRHLIAGVNIKDLSSKDITKYRDDRLGQVSSQTVRNELALIFHIIKVARFEWEYPISDGIGKNIAKPLPSKPRTRRISINEYDHMVNVLSKCRNPLPLKIVRFATLSGMRRGEILSLKWRDINFEQRTAFLPTTKNGDPRLVPLCHEAIRILSEFPIHNPTDTVFDISPNALRQTWDRTIQKTGVKNLRFHDLRHEAISRFFEMGLSVPEVALISGHKDARMLFRYTHLKAEDVAKKLHSISMANQPSSKELKQNGDD